MRTVRAEPRLVDVHIQPVLHKVSGHLHPGGYHSVSLWELAPGEDLPRALRGIGDLLPLQLPLPLLVAAADGRFGHAWSSQGDVVFFFSYGGVVHVSCSNLGGSSGTAGV